MISSLRKEKMPNPSRSHNIIFLHTRILDFEGLMVLITKDNTIHGISLLNLIKKYNFEKIDVLKIDIQGSEKSILNENHIFHCN